jgi:glutamate 5-kinase
MPTQQQSRSRRNQRENIDLTLEELIKEELLRVINEEE